MLDFEIVKQAAFECELQKIADKDNGDKSDRTKRILKGLGIGAASAGILGGGLGAMSHIGRTTNLSSIYNSKTKSLGNSISRMLGHNKYVWGASGAIIPAALAGGAVGAGIGALMNPKKKQ
jgi:hypothetical protein